MIEPSGLLAAVLTDLAREGVRYFLRRMNQSSIDDAYDLSGGSGVTTRVDLSFAAPYPARPYWVLVGLQSRHGPRRDIPVLYPEPLSLVVPRDEYEIVALFLSKPKAFDDLPYLKAWYQTHDVLASRRQQQLQMQGELPTARLVAWLDRHIPQESRAFRVPVPTPQRGVLSSGLGQPLPTSRVVRVRPRSGTPTQRPLSPEIQRALDQITAPRQLAPPPTARKVSRAQPASADGMCLARTRKGSRCLGAADHAKGTLCATHYTMVEDGRTVLWHRTGTPIKLLPKT